MYDYRTNEAQEMAENGEDRDEPQFYHNDEASEEGAVFDEDNQSADDEVDGEDLDDNMEE